MRICLLLSHIVVLSQKHINTFLLNLSFFVETEVKYDSPFKQYSYRRSVERVWRVRCITFCSEVCYFPRAGLILTETDTSKKVF